MTAPSGPDYEASEPAGERLGLAGWVRTLGYQITSGRRAPGRIWPRQNVCIVSDESDLVSATYGPRGISGGSIAPVVGEFSIFEILAGPNGCRVWGAHASAQVCRFGYRATATTITAAVNVPVVSTDPAQRCTTTVRSGSAAADPTTPGDAHDAIGGWQPVNIWVAPGQRLVMFRTTANIALDVALILQEPGSAPR